MARFVILVASVLLIATIGCDNSDRIDRLEKQNQELQAQVKKTSATADYDLQAKCSKDARGWFNENWSRDKDTLLLDFTNHYNKNLNKCFILVEFHYSTDKEGSWTSSMTMWDVYENSKYGEVRKSTDILTKPEYRTDEHVYGCEVAGQKCKSVEEFNGLVRSYLND